MNNGIIFMMIWWIPIFVYLIIWSIRARILRRKNPVDIYVHRQYMYPDKVPEKTNKLTEHELLGESLIYASATIMGPIMFILIGKNLIKELKNPTI